MNRSYATTIGLLLAFFISVNIANAAQTDIAGPATSSFGQSVTVLPNGNIVVTAPFYDIPAGATDVGAVYLYDGATLALISTLTGSTANDRIGSNGIAVLTNGNFVVPSTFWNGSRGAVTFINGTTGLSGIVSSANSLVGGTANDRIGNNAVIVLTNGNYVVPSTFWSNGAAANAGAVTWGSGTSGISGVVSSANSLVGSSTGDSIGGVTALTNGNYVVRSQNWDNTATGAADAGSVTWGNGATGTSGVVSSANSLVGSSVSDSVGNGGITVLTNGNYVVRSPAWDNTSPAAADAGAATWGNGLTGISGIVSSANSLVGSSVSDSVGNGGIIALTNGNYVVASTAWDNTAPAAANAGATTWGNGLAGISGTVTAANSLVGSSVNDVVSSGGVVALTNGNYVVISSNWDNTSPAAADVGAVTWGNGGSGTSGTVSSANSLVGGAASDQVGSGGVIALTNGNYVVRSQSWDNGAATDAGAATWGNGTSGATGTVSSANSLVGSSASDFVSSGSIAALTNGNYVVRSPLWNDGALVDAGAATWGSGTSGISGTISAANSLVGSTASDNVSNNGVTALTNGNYVVLSQNWDNGAATNVGAATWGNGATGTVGTVSSANSLVGTVTLDSVSNNGVVALNNGNYLVRSPAWDNGAINSAGAITWGNGTGGTVGAVSAANSLVGSTIADQVGNSFVTALSNGNYGIISSTWDNGGILNATAATFGNGVIGTSGVITDGAAGGNSVVGTTGTGVSTFAFDETRNRLVVGRSASNAVSILFFTTTAIADGDLNNPANWDNGVPNALLTGIIPSGRSMTISTKMNIGQIQVQCGASLTGGSNSAYIIGGVRRDFCAASNETFTYPLGDVNNYSPLTVSNTNGTGSLTASVTDNFLTGLPTAKSLSRYWSLTGAGITTDLTFNYVNADINGNENDYRLFKRSSATNVTVPILSALLNTAANTLTATNVSQFSDWSAGDAPLIPTAANVSVSGRVLTNEGAALRNAIVYLTDSSGNTRKAQTGSFGNFTFEGIEAGETVVITVVAKRFTFAPRTLQVNDNVTGFDFAALPD